MNQYVLKGRMGEGAFSEVLLGQEVDTGDLVAIKCMKDNFKSIEDVQRNKEINVLHYLNPHRNIIQLLEAIYDEGTGIIVH